MVGWGMLPVLCLLRWVQSLTSRTLFVPIFPILSPHMTPNTHAAIDYCLCMDIQQAAVSI